MGSPHPWRRRYRPDRGQSTLEYALIASVIILVVIAMLITVGKKTNTAFCKTDNGFVALNCVSGTQENFQAGPNFKTNGGCNQNSWFVPNSSSTQLWFSNHCTINSGCVSPTVAPCADIESFDVKTQTTTVISTGSYGPADVLPYSDGTIYYPTETYNPSPPAASPGGPDLIIHISATGTNLCWWQVPNVGGHLAGTAQVMIGPDGNLWFTETGSGQIGMATLASCGFGTTVTTFYSLQGSGPTAGGGCLAAPCGHDAFGGMTIGPDGNLWVADLCNNLVGRVTVGTGAVTYWSLPAGTTGTDAFVCGGTAENGASNVTVGKDKKMYLVESHSDAVVQIVPNGAGAPTLTAFSIQSGSHADKTIIGPDGNIWLEGNNQVGRFDIDTKTAQFWTQAGTCPGAMATGSDRTIYYIDQCTGEIGQVY